MLASGDPFLHGVGATLARGIAPAEMTVIPAASAFGLAAARLGWALQDVETVSLHGRPEALIRPLLHPGARILALTSDGGAPARLARRLAAAGFGPSRLHVLEALGGPGERHRSGRAADFGETDCAALNVVAIEVAAEAGAAVLPLAGLDDGLFEHDGQITKREVRAVTLAALAPRRGELLWDVGAGSGSVGIEWMLRHPSLRAIAVEASAERAARIRRNAEALGVPGLAVHDGDGARRACRAAGARRGVPWRRGHRSGGARRGDRGAAGRRKARRQRGDARHAGAADRDRGPPRRQPDVALGGARRSGGRDDRVAAGDAGRAMVVGEAVRVAGLGSRRGVTGAEVLAAVAAARAAFGAPALDALAALPAKAGEAGFAEAARALGLPLVIAAPAADARLASGSAASRAATGAASASEAAALGAAGPSARLLGPRVVAGRVTCAIAVTEEGP